MEKLLEGNHGIEGLLAALVVSICLHLILKIINLTITAAKNIRENDGKKMDHLSDAMDENTRAILKLNEEVKYFNQRVADHDMLTLKTDRHLRRLIAVVKEVAGERWGPIQKKVDEETFIRDGEDQ